MAPPKALWPARITSPNFLGINWARVGWHTPMSSLYPQSVCGGSMGRVTSNPLWTGRADYRTPLQSLRSAVLIVPSVVMGGIFFFMADLYEIIAVTYYFLNVPLPENIAAEHKKEMNRQSREKPGYPLMHKLGGQVSMPGSDLNVRD